MKMPLEPIFYHNEPKVPQEYKDITETYRFLIYNYSGYSLEDIKLELERLSGTKIDYKDAKIYIDFSIDRYSDCAESNSSAYVEIKKESVLNSKFKQEMKKYEKDMEKYLLKKQEYEKAKKEYPKKLKAYKEYTRQQQIENAKKILIENGIKEI